jgi:hypothetical protein
MKIFHINEDKYEIRDGDDKTCYRFTSPRSFVSSKGNRAYVVDDIHIGEFSKPLTFNKDDDILIPNCTKKDVYLYIQKQEDTGYFFWLNRIETYIVPLFMYLLDTPKTFCEFFIKLEMFMCIHSISYSSCHFNSSIGNVLYYLIPFRDDTYDWFNLSFFPRLDENQELFYKYPSYFYLQSTVLFDSRERTNVYLVLEPYSSGTFKHFEMTIVKINKKCILFEIYDEVSDNIIDSMKVNDDVDKVILLTKPVVSSKSFDNYVGDYGIKYVQSKTVPVENRTKWYVWKVNIDDLYTRNAICIDGKIYFDKPVFSNTNEPLQISFLNYYGSEMVIYTDLVEGCSYECCDRELFFITHVFHIHCSQAYDMLLEHIEQLQNAIRTIRKAWIRAYYDPSYTICKRRLHAEFLCMSL